MQEHRLNRRKRSNGIGPSSRQPNDPPGLKTPEASNSWTPIEGLQLFIPPSFVNLMVEQTNLYAHQTYQSLKPPKSPWRDVRVEEMLAFLGMNIATGIVNLPEVNMYWSTNPPFLF